MERKNKKYYAFYKIVQAAFRPAFRLAFGIRRKDRLVLPDEPCLVLANHCCYIDPIIVGVSIKQPVNFVITENLLRNKFMGWVFLRLLHCIPCAKGGQNAQTVFDMARQLKAGHHVLLYPEGNMTYDGATAPAIPSTGKLLRSLKCTVVTVRVAGAYQILPRWSKKFCFGKVKCNIVNVYPAGTFYRKPAAEILDVINRDLYIEQPPREACDFSKSGAGENVSIHKYNRDATGLDCLLFACPVCKKLGQIRTHGREVSCACGAVWKYGQYGFLENENTPDGGMGEGSKNGDFSTLYQWNAWQQDYLKKLAKSDSSLTYSVSEAQLSLISKDHELKKVAEGTFTMTRDHISCGDTSFPLSEVSHMDTRDKGVLLFSLRDGSYYEVVSKNVYPGLLFKTLFSAY